MNASLFGIISIICYITSIVFIAFSVFLFFFLDIKNAYGIYTGKNFVKGVEEIKTSDRRLHFYEKNSKNKESHTEKIISGVDQNMKGVAHPSKQLGMSINEKESINTKTSLLTGEQTTILNDNTMILGDDTIVLQPTIDLDEEVETIDIHFDVIEEIKIIHSNQIIEERGKQE